MQNLKKVAVVTGSNKGIGFAIVKSLARKFNGIVYLTARNESIGIKAVKNLQDEGISVNFHQLDIEDSHSIERFSQHLKEKYDGLDVLINNAAIPYHHRENDFTPEIDQVINTIRVNFSSTLNVCNALFPLLRPNARVVNVSSRAGFLSNIKDQNLIDRIASKTFSIEESIQLMDEYIQLAKSGQHKNLASNCYAMSKIGLNLLTEAQQILFDKDERKNIVVNSCTPGYCATDMTSYSGPLTPEEGAKTPVFLALLPENCDAFKGKFWADEQFVDWKDTRNIQKNN